VRTAIFVSRLFWAEEPKILKAMISGDPSQLKKLALNCTRIEGHSSKKKYGIT
jgi:hypothetical protein